MTSERQSPTLARCENSFSASMKARALLARAAQVEAEHRAAAARQQPLGERMVGMALELGIADAARPSVVAGEEGDDLARVLDVARHAQRQRLDALQDQPGGVRAHAGAEVAQALAPRAQQERADACSPR